MLYLHENIEKQLSHVFSVLRIPTQKRDKMDAPRSAFLSLCQYTATDNQKELLNKILQNM